jgi:transposase InsO family protein
MPLTGGATPASVLDRALVRALRRKPLERHALRVLLRAHRLLGLLLAHRLAEMRAQDDPLQRAQGEVQASDILSEALREAVSLLGDRLDKLPERRRPHYSPSARFRILRLRHLLGLDQHDAAALFRVSAGTIATSHRFGGAEKIAEHLARAGWRIAETTVRGILREPRLPPSPVPLMTNRAVVARFVHHVWHLDLTEIPGLFGSAPRFLALVLDGFSRMPLAWIVSDERFKTDDLQQLVESARARIGKPRHLVVDKGGEFRARSFRHLVGVLGVRLRFCSAANHRANARLERFWLTLKSVLRLVPPVPHVSEDEIQRAITHYAYYRPHRGLGGATPAEVYFGETPAHLNATPPPRGRCGDRTPFPVPFTVEFVDGDDRFPYLRRAA